MLKQQPLQSLEVNNCSSYTNYFVIKNILEKMQQTFNCNWKLANFGFELKLCMKL